MTKALSLTVFAEPSNVTDGQTDRRTDRQTDRRTDRISITIGDLMLRADALASVVKNYLKKLYKMAAIFQDGG